MTEFDAIEQAYKNGYEKGYQDGWQAKEFSEKERFITITQDKLILRRNALHGLEILIPISELGKLGYKKDNPSLVCPVCGKEMDETYLGRQYCKECEERLKG